MSYFDLPFIIKDEKALIEFKNWHAGEVASGKLWNFEEELQKYCEQDVAILAQIVKGYHNAAEAIAGTSPWFNATAPSFVHETILVQLSKELELPNRHEDMALYKASVEEVATKTGWGVLEPNEYWHAHLALRGGRTDVRKMYHTVTDDDYRQGKWIVYQDICSQYPFQQIVHHFPTGLPKIHVWDTKYFPCVKHQNSEQMRKTATCPCTDKWGDKLCDIIDLVGAPSWSAEDILSDVRFFGIITVTLRAPKNLYHPVIVSFADWPHCYSAARCSSPADVS